jgi:hypothetical protein
VTGGDDDTPLHEAIATDPELQELLKGMQADEAAGVDVETATAAALDETPTEAAAAGELPEIDTDPLEAEIAALLGDANKARGAILAELDALTKLATAKRGSRGQLVKRLDEICAGLASLRARLDDGSDDQ